MNVCYAESINKPVPEVARDTNRVKFLHLEEHSRRVCVLNDVADVLKRGRPPCVGSPLSDSPHHNILYTKKVHDSEPDSEQPHILHRNVYQFSIYQNPED